MTTTRPSTWKPRSVRAAASLSAAAVTMLAIAAIAFATAPVNGTTYRGTFTAGFDVPTISFKVSVGGRRVTHLHTTAIGIYCAGRLRDTPVTFTNAAIAANGTFRSTGRYRVPSGPRKGQILARLTVTGRFASDRKETGVMTTTFTSVLPKVCSAQSRYTTKAS